MESSNLKSTLTLALKSGGASIRKCLIEDTRSVEKTFSTPFIQQLQGNSYRTEVHQDELQTISFFPGRSSGKIDLVTFDPMGGIDTAFEFKAVRMPRDSKTASNSLYDIGQISSDYLRLGYSPLLVDAWIVVFVYGCMVDDATSAGDLFRRFQNQMFVDVSNAKMVFTEDTEAYEYEKINLRSGVFEALGWNQSHMRADMTEDQFAVLVRNDTDSDPACRGADLGAICFRVQ